MTDLLLLLLGLALLLGGGDLLVRGASALAAGLGIPPLVIGLTVVAFGTSAPELAVNLTAALAGSSAISFGNIIGSNIANIGLIVGATALLRPLAISGAIVGREIPMMLLASAAALVMAFDHALRGAPAELFDRADGLVLLLFFGVFLYYTVSGVLRSEPRDPLAAQAAELQPPGARRAAAAWLNLLLAAGGLAALLAGGRLTVTAAVALARALGVPEVIVGLTVVAVGTSLPELATSVIAAWRGQTDLAIGNVVGSNIFNLLFVAGVSAAVHPIAVPAGGHRDLLAMAGLSLLLLPLALSQRRITRAEGGLLLLCYLLYTAWRALA